MGDLQRQATQIRDIRFSEAGIEDARSSTDAVVPEKIAAKQKRHQLADASPTRGLPVHIDASSSHFSKRLRKGLGSKPQQSYHEFLSLDQAGLAMIAHDNSYERYAIKKVDSKPDMDARKVQSFRGTPCVVCVLDIYRSSLDEKIHIVYEKWDVSLKHILSTPWGDLNPAEIAAICKEVGALQAAPYWYHHN